jgi:Sulfotransferase domain
MKVIGAGISRTGTMTMQAALETPGYHCYHMKEVPREPGHLDAWYQFVTRQAPMDWQTLFRKFEATVDTPACWYYQELMEAFPEAKVILTVREPERWYASFVTLRTTVNRVRPVSRLIPKMAKMVRFADALFDKIFGGSLDHANCIRVFNAHNEAVQRLVPKDRLLVFQVADGWEPLCKFLGCPVPEGMPFPHLNEGDQTLKDVVRQLFIGPWVRRIALTAIGLAVLAWWLL